MSKNLALSLGVVAVIAAQTASAQLGGNVKAFSSLSYQYTFDSDDRPNDAGHGVHISGGYFFTRNFALELAADYSEFSSDDVPPLRDGKSVNFKLGGLWSFTPAAQYMPYVGLGGGLANNELDPPDENRRRGFLEGTVGVMTYLNSYLGLRGEFAYRYTDGVPGNALGTANSSANEAILRVGVLFPLVSAVPVVDQPAPQPERVLDSDGDGVPDNLDECPDTAEGVRVNARGCPIDSDADGVPDYIDECPGTAAGVQVDERGCPVDVAIDRKFEDINFGFDKHNLTDYAKSTLDKTAAEIRQLIAENNELQVNLEGHTDSIGTVEYNQRLGEKRANVVRDYLVEKGVGAARITTRSAGEKQPIATNETDKGRLLNRRVEIRATSGNGN